MNSLTTHYRRTQLVAFPIPGGTEEIQYCYGIRIAGGVEPVSHGFAEWVVGDFNSQAGQQLCKNSTESTATGGETLSGLPVTTGKSSKSYSDVKTMSMTVCSQLSGYATNLQGLKNEH